jgi:hypothetical protein
MDEEKRNELDRFYRSTDYVVRSDDGEIILSIDTNSREIDDLMAAAGVRSWAFLTAWNPGSQPLPRDENDRRQERLMADLKDSRFKFLRGTTVDPMDKWEPVESFFVLGIERDDAAALATKYGQNAIVFGRISEPSELVWCR